MSYRPVRFSKCEVSRAYRALADKGVLIDRIEVSPSGVIRIYPAQNQRAVTVPPVAKTTPGHSGDRS
jgi:hypothetical protein